LPITPAVWPKPFDVPEPKPNVPSITFAFRLRSPSVSGDDVAVSGTQQIFLQAVPFDESSMDTFRLQGFAPSGEKIFSESPMLEFIRTLAVGSDLARMRPTPAVSVRIGDVNVDVAQPDSNRRTWWGLSTGSVDPFNEHFRVSNFYSLGGYSRDPAVMAATGLNAFAPLLAQRRFDYEVELTFRAWLLPASSRPLDPVMSAVISSGEMTLTNGFYRGSRVQMYAFNGSWRLRCNWPVPGGSSPGVTSATVGRQFSAMAAGRAAAEFSASARVTVGTSVRTVDLGTLDDWDVTNHRGEYRGAALDWINDIDPKPATASYELTVTRK